jgi:hypothetical protein
MYLNIGGVYAMTYEQDEVEFEVKVLKCSTVAFNLPAGTGRGGYAGYQTPPEDIVMYFNYNGEEKEESIRDRIFAKMSWGKNLIEKRANAIWISKPPKLTIDINRNGDYVGVNEAWLDGWIEAIKLKYKEKYFPITLPSLVKRSA